MTSYWSRGPPPTTSIWYHVDIIMISWWHHTGIILTPYRRIGQFTLWYHADHFIIMISYWSTLIPRIKYGIWIHTAGWLLKIFVVQSNGMDFQSTQSTSSPLNRQMNGLEVDWMDWTTKNFNSHPAVWIQTPYYLSLVLKSINMKSWW